MLSFQVAVHLTVKNGVILKLSTVRHRSYPEAYPLVEFASGYIQKAYQTLHLTLSDLIA